MPGMTAAGVRKRIPSTLGRAFISLCLIYRCAHREYDAAQGKQQCECSSTRHLSWPHRGRRAERRPLLGFLTVTWRGARRARGSHPLIVKRLQTSEFYMNSRDFKMLLQISEKHHMGQIKHGPHWPPVLMRGEVSPTSSAAALQGLGEEEGL